VDDASRYNSAQYYIQDKIVVNRHTKMISRDFTLLGHWRKERQEEEEEEEEEESAPEPWPFD
jgi:hypothetical protein